MYQAFTEDQIQIRDLVRDFTRKEITPVAHIYDEKNLVSTVLLFPKHLVEWVMVLLNSVLLQKK